MTSVGFHVVLLLSHLLGGRQKKEKKILRILNQNKEKVKANWMLFSNTHRAGTREVHNKLEKNRRAHLRECFEFLRKQLPAIDDKKLSNLGILKSALRHIQVTKTNTKKTRAFISLPPKKQLLTRPLSLQCHTLHTRSCCFLGLFGRMVGDGHSDPGHIEFSFFFSFFLLKGGPFRRTHTHADPECAHYQG